MISGLLLIGVLLIVDGGLRPTGVSTSTRAIVIESASCRQQGARDTVEIMVDDQLRPVPLNGCGNAVGTAVDVDLVGDSDDLVAHLAATGSSRYGGLTGQLHALLFGLALVGGGMLVVVVRAGQARTARAAAPAPDL